MLFYTMVEIKNEVRLVKSIQQDASFNVEASVLSARLSTRLDGTEFTLLETSVLDSLQRADDMFDILSETVFMERDYEALDVALTSVFSELVTSDGEIELQIIRQEESKSMEG